MSTNDVLVGRQVTRQSEAGFNGYIHITRLDVPFLDLLNLVFKLALAQAIIAAPIAVVLYLLLR